MADLLFHILPTVQARLALSDLGAPLIKQALMFQWDWHVKQANPHLPPELLHNLEFVFHGQIFDLCNAHKEQSPGFPAQPTHF